MERPKEDTYPAQTEMFLSLRVVVNAAFLDVAKALAHVMQEALVDVVIQMAERHLFWKDHTDVVLIVLKHVTLLWIYY